MAFLSLTKTSLFASQPLFFLNFRLYLFASEVYPLTGVSPCHCNQVRVTGHRLSSLIVKFLIFIFFFQAWDLFHDITHFLKQDIFPSSISDFTCNQLGHPHYLSTSLFQFWLLSTKGKKKNKKNSVTAFSILFPRISTPHFLAIIIGYSIFFWLTPHAPPQTNIVTCIR